MTIVELMITLVIGLILMLGATGVLITNQRAFNTTESLSLIQENSRIAVDMVSRDIREAGGHPCLVMNLADHTGGNQTAAASKALLNSSAGILVNPGINPGNRNTGQGALQMVTVTDTLSVTAHSPGSNVFTVDNNLQAGDIMVACTGQSAHLFEVSSATASTVTVTQAPSVNLTGASIASGLNTRNWYIGTDNFLYRSEGNSAGVQMIDNVFGLNATDLGNGAIEVTFTLCSRNQETGISNPNNQICAPEQIERQVTTVVQRRTA